MFQSTIAELTAAPKLNAALIPKHLHSQFSQYLPHSQEGADSNVDTSANNSPPVGEAISHPDLKSLSSQASAGGQHIVASSSSASSHNARFGLSSKPPHVTSSSSSGLTSGKTVADHIDPTSMASTTSLQSNTTNTVDSNSSTITSETSAVTSATNTATAAATAASSVVTN